MSTVLKAPQNRPLLACGPVPSPSGSSLWPLGSSRHRLWVEKHSWHTLPSHLAGLCYEAAAQYSVYSHQNMSVSFCPHSLGLWFTPPPRRHSPFSRDLTLRLVRVMRMRWMATSVSTGALPVSLKACKWKTCSNLASIHTDFCKSRGFAVSRTDPWYISLIIAGKANTTKMVETS